MPLRPGPVLNALRHHGPEHSTGIEAALGRPVECSTPYGITARSIGRAFPTRASRKPAQRLTASRPGAFEELRCLVDQRKLLNALRHHGPEHKPRRRTRSTGCTRAQCLTASRPGASVFVDLLALAGLVLNALRHHGPEHARPGSRRCGPRARLLNALRHHGPEHRRRSRRSWPKHEHLLNALRHHGPEHEASRSASAKALSCSTPYGITARSMALRATAMSWSPTSAQRLTASRPGAFSVQTAAYLTFDCSTPYGITARSIRGIMGTTLANMDVCSTPYGITARSMLGAGEGRTEGIPDVLNALRHHGPEHHQPGIPFALERMCSTPYGITARGMALGLTRDEWADYCSTPYGITARGMLTRRGAAKGSS